MPSTIALFRSTSGHVRHHARFYTATLIGIVLWFAVARLVPGLRLVSAGDGFFAAYLLSMAPFAWCSTPERLRRRAESEDEGITVIALIALIAVVLSFASIFSVLKSDGSSNSLQFALAIAGVPLGWFTLHTIAAFHYAHLYYTPVDRQNKVKQVDTGGLQFPGAAPPTSVDFLYYSFVVAMTAQVSDVQVLTSPMRRATLIHGVASFFFNTVILALAVNVAAGLVH